MAPKNSNKDKQSPIERFETIPPEIEDEILETYSQFTLNYEEEEEEEEEPKDLTLNQLIEFFDKLMIPKCFIEDIINCIDYYNLIIKPSSSLKLDPLNPKQSMTISLIQAYTITNNVNNDLNDIIDIIDIDKLLRNVNRLIKFRNNYNHIQQSWKLFVMSCCSTTNIENDRHIENYKLTLPDLKTIKTNLNLDNPQTNESFLIDMLSCCTHDSNGHILNFDYTKNKHGTHISIKDFAEILGNLGELD